MSLATRLIFHVGLHKTGTTTLQQSVFPMLGGMVYLGRGAQHPLLSAFLAADHPVLFYSDETILGRLVDVYRVPRKARLSWTETQVNALHRLNATFPQAEVIIGLRRQESLLLSLYKHYLRYGGNLEFHEFFTRDESGLIAPDDLLFLPRVHAALSAFSGRTFIYFLEDLVATPHTVIARIADFLGSSCPDSLPLKKLNEGLSDFEARLTRRLNSIPLYAGTDHPDRCGMGSKLLRRWRLSPYKITKRIARLTRNETSIALDADTSKFINTYYSNDLAGTADLLQSIGLA